jgi:8-oxo-dGTP pyrophosphatase MutT (NUDIX family)
MNYNDYKKVVHLAIWIDNKIVLSKRNEPGKYHHEYWQDAGGKVQKGEDLLRAICREVEEEMDIYVHPTDLKLVDCFIYHKRKIKSFLFTMKGSSYLFNQIRNTEPNKCSDWELFTLEEALKLKKIVPSVKYYLESLK